MDGARSDSVTGGGETSKKSRMPRLVLILGAIALAFALLLVGVGFGAERWVNRKKDAALADLSAQLGRPVTAGPVRLALLRGRVEVRDIVVGRDPTFPQEPDPAVRLDRAYLDVAVASAITSLGKRVEVRQILVERPLVQVSRDKEGKLNLQRLAERLPKSEPKQPEPLDPATRERIEGVVIRSLRVDDARLRFLDLARQGATAEISDLDVVLADVSLRKAFQAHISAAVLAARKNFDLKARFSPAPSGQAMPGSEGALPPPPLERLTMKLEPVPLAPLSPFIGSVVGGGLEELAEGKLSMDFTAVPGAASPGGKGPTSLRGFVALESLKFAGGERFDARLDTQMGGNLDQGALEVTQLAAQLGAMSLQAQARMANLQGAPRVEKFTVQSEGLDFSRLRQYYPPLDRVTGAELRGPFTVEANGQGSVEEQKLTARLDLTPASVVVPGQLRKPAGTPLSLELRATAGPELVRVERLALTLAKVVMTAAASLRTQGTGPGARQTPGSPSRSAGSGWGFEATLDAPTFAVREIGALVAPKETADLPDMRVAFNAKASGTVGKPETIRAEVPDLKVSSGRSDLAGRLSVQNLRKPRLSFDGRSRYLDLDDFVPADEARTAAKGDGAKGDSAKGNGKDEKAGTRGTATRKARPAQPLPPMVREMEGTVALAVARGRAAGIDYRDLRTDVTLKNGRLQARTLEVGALGGRFSGAGSEFPLPGTSQAFVARGEVEGLDLAAAIAQFAGEADILTGKLSGKLDLNGLSVEPKELLRTLTGQLSGRVSGAQFLPASLLEPVVQALENVPRGAALLEAMRGASQRASLLRDRNLRELAGAVRFAEGALEIATPLKAQTPSGALSVQGRIGLDGQADLNAELSLAPEVASALLGGRARFDQPIPVQLRIDGPLKRPRIRPTQPTQLARVFLASLARTQAGEAVRGRAAEATERATGEAREQAEKATEAAAQARKAAEERAREEAQKAREAAGRRLRGILGR
jgi:uncharacterized protein involved in outer membrane biogenesis